MRPQTTSIPLPLAIGMLLAFGIASYAAPFGPADRLVITFSAKANSSDLLLLFNNDVLTVNGRPVFTTRLYDGNTLLGTWTGPPLVFQGRSFFSCGFASEKAIGPSAAAATKISFTPIAAGTIAGRLVTTVSGGSVSGFDPGHVNLYNSVSLGTGHRPQRDITIASLVLESAPALAHLVAGDTWTSGILVINTSNASARFSIDFRDDSGRSVVLPFSQGATSTLSGSLPAHGSAYFEAAAPGSPPAIAWGQVVADPAIVVHGLFRNNVDGTYYEAGVAATPGSLAFQIPFEAGSLAPTMIPLYTGLAVANLDSSTPARLTCTARNSAGTIIAGGVTVPPIPALGHWADYMFPALTGQRGTIDCTSTTSVVVLALRFIGTTAFSSLPVIQK